MAFTFILVDWDKVNAANPGGIVAWLGAVLANGLTGDELKSATRWTFIVAGIASLILAAFSLLLPHTPPKKSENTEGAESLAWLEAVKLLRLPFVLVLWFVTFVDSFVHNCYFNWTGTFLAAAPSDGGVGIAGNWVMPVMSVGQSLRYSPCSAWSNAQETRLANHHDRRHSGHALRFAVYSFFPSCSGLIIFVQVVHGVCYAFFFATVYIFVDEYFPKDVRSSAQGLFNVMILGVGALVANLICPWLIQEKFTGPDGITDLRTVSAAMSASTLAAIALALFFHPPKKQESHEVSVESA